MKDFIKDKLSLEDIKKIELEILNYITSICDKYNLSYFLAYGTLIGAIRHKGFIPWDDDIDIAMPRKDYNVLLEILKEKRGTNKYDCLIPNEDGYFYEFAKVVDTTTEVKELNTSLKSGGLWVDVFPLDGLRKDDKFAHFCLMFLNRCRAASVNINFPHKTKGIAVALEFLFWKLCRCIGYKLFLKISLKMSQKYNYDDCEYIGYASSFPAHNKYLKKEWFRDFVYVDFENNKYKAPIEYDKYLTAQYGDYMQIPPVEKRITHAMEAYRITD